MKDEIIKAFEDGGFDHVTALARLGDKEALYYRFLGMFLEDTSAAQFGEAVEKGDFAAAYDAVHTLKGVSANLNIDRVTDCTKRVLEKLRAGDNQAAADMNDELQALNADACAVINKVLELSRQ